MPLMYTHFVTYMNIDIANVYCFKIRFYVLMCKALLHHHLVVSTPKYK